MYVNTYFDSFVNSKSLSFVVGLGFFLNSISTSLVEMADGSCHIRCILKPLLPVLEFLKIDPIVRLMPIIIRIARR